MPRGSYKIFMDVASSQVSPKQKEWLENKAIEQTRKLGREVTQAMILRALIQKQMDCDEEKKKVWNDEVQISSAV